MRKIFAFVLVVVAAATGRPDDPPQPNLAGLSCTPASPSLLSSSDACPATAKSPARLPELTAQAKAS